ncbi:MAG: phenylalanine--tRNA ligase subunit beta [Candidatus Aenigmatarchaeota archaeon]
MPVASFDIKELEELTGKDLNKDLLENKVPMLGCDLERINREEVDYEIFPDRPDLLSVEGFARALRYFFGLEKGIKEYESTESGIELNLEKSVDPVRPCISAAVIRNIKLNDDVLRSLMQVQEKIHQTFGRGRKKIAIGIHDLDKVEPPFTYRGVKPEEIEFVPLQAEEKMNLKEIGEKHPKGNYTQILEGNERWPIIVDKNGEVLSFPPVINGKLTEVSEETENIFIDVTGTDRKSVEQALNVVVTSLAERGGEIETVSVDGEERPNLSNKEMEVDLEYVNRLLDLDLSREEFAELIRGMGLDYSDGKVSIPCYRTDIMHPIDIVEDAAISHGYSNFGAHIPEVPGIGDPQDVEEFSEKMRELMIGFGFQEVKTSVLTSKDKQFERMEKGEEEVAEMENPLSEKHNICRKNIMPGLLEVLGQNQHRSYPQKIFEIGDVVEVVSKEETGARNKRKLSGLICDGTINYADLASRVISLLEILDKDVKIKDQESRTYLGNRSGKIIADGEEIGIIGEIHPQVLENWRLEKPAVAFEIDLEKIKLSS